MSVIGTQAAGPPLVSPRASRWATQRNRQLLLVACLLLPSLVVFVQIGRAHV